jgi:hypothetical protein
MYTPSANFNLINVDTLKEKTNEIQRYKMQEEADRLAWDEIANEEAKRLVRLFKDDLPNTSVQKYGKENGHYDLPNVLIRRDDNTSTHYESCVTIEVLVDRKNDVNDSLGNFYTRGVKLYYIHSYSYRGEKFETIEELVSDWKFLEALRTRVL